METQTNMAARNVMSDFKTQRFLTLIIWTGVYFHLIFKINKITIKKIKKEKKNKLGLS